MRTTTSIFILIMMVNQLLFAQNSLRVHHNKSIEAYKSKDYESFLFHMQKADSISPNHPSITYNLAAAYALTGENEESLALLKKAVLMNTRLSATDDLDFEKVKGLSAFDEVRLLRDSLLTNVSESKVAFTNSELDLHPESIAYDHTSNSFLMSSVRKNKIVNYNLKNGKTTDWKKTGEDGLWAVMGMKIDTRKDILWVCTVATKEMTNYQKELEGKTAVLKFDLKTKKLLKRYDLSGGHWFGDLILDEEGTPYISDSMKPVIYIIKDDELKVFKDFSDQLFNLQGLAFNTKKDLLYIGDYKIGIHVFNMKNSKLKKLRHSDNMITKGVDGLYFYNNKLISIHNGVNPFRVCEYKLDKSGEFITSIKYIDRGREELGEPTLGVIVNNKFYYIANSPWGAYDREGNFNIDGLKENIILESNLK